MTRFQHAVNTVPFLGICLIAVIAGVVLLDIAAAIGWFIRILEIQSVYDRLLPDWTAMNFFTTSLAATVVAKLLGKGLPD